MGLTGFDQLGSLRAENKKQKRDRKQLIFKYFLSLLFFCKNQLIISCIAVIYVLFVTRLLLVSKLNYLSL